MYRKLREIIILSVVLIGLGGGVGIGLAREGSDSSIIGPYTDIRVPIEDLPALNEDLVYHPVVDMETLSLVDEEHSRYEQFGAKLQVLYVLKDPRDVPLARYATYADGGVVLPNNNLINQDLITINVYVRVEGPELREDVLDPVDTDPVLYSENAELRWPALYVVPLSFEQEGISTYPCAPVEYADGTAPYLLPAEIAGGGAAGEDGLYDPAAYAPPKPWYYNEDPLLVHGDIREGWVSCLAPDLPLEQLQIKYRHTGVSAPEIAFVEKDRPLDDLYPSQSELEEVGLSSPALPQTNGECAEMDYCINTITVNLDNCKQAAFEAGLEQGICAGYDFYNAFADYQESETYEEGEVVDIDKIIADSKTTEVRAYYTTKTSEQLGNSHKSYLLWNYTVAKSFPVSLIKLEDVSLIFADNTDSNNIIKDTGSVSLYDPLIDYTARNDSVRELGYDISVNEGPANRYHFFSRVIVEPENLTRDDLEGYRLYQVEAQINALISHEGVVYSFQNNNLDTSNYYRQTFEQPSDPFEGIIYFSLGSGFEPINHKSYGPFGPDTALININPIYVDSWEHGSKHSIHPVNVISIFNPNLVASTNMCDVVDCLEVSNPETRLTYSSEFPPRTVPIMCHGEWSNNFVIDGVELVPEMYHIGEAWGLGYDPITIHSGSERFDGNSKVLLYDGRVMGGASPWWIYGTVFDGIFGRIIGNVVDLETGLYLYNQANIIPYYERVDKNVLAQGYFSPGSNVYKTSQLVYNKGWIGDIAEDKVLIFGTIDFYKDTRFDALSDNNTGFLFQGEGPVWVTECSRQIISNLADQELYTQTNSDMTSAAEGGEHRMKELLSGMDYPPSLPVVPDEVIPLGEYSDPVSFGNYRIAAKQIKIVPGKPEISTVYVESENKYYPAERYPNFNNEVFFARAGAVVIPPDTSLVRVKISLDYIANDNDPLTRCHLETESFQLAYPGYLPIPGIGERRYPERWPCDIQDYSTWITFLFPSLDIDLDKMLLSVRTDAQDPWQFYSLTEN